MKNPSRITAGKAGVALLGAHMNQLGERRRFGAGWSVDLPGRAARVPCAHRLW